MFSKSAHRVALKIVVLMRAQRPDEGHERQQTQRKGTGNKDQQHIHGVILPSKR